MVNWEEVRATWEASSISFKDLAEKYDVKDATIRSRKNREKWQRNNATQRATKKKSVATEKKSRGAPKGNQNGKGNKGNSSPSTRFPNHNSIQRKHGLFSKFLHEEQVEIIDAMTDLDFADQLWLQIEIKFSAIVRMQKIMWVETDDDHLKEESGNSSSEFGDSTTYKVAFAFERYESYIRAQTRAMAEYRNLVKHYLELTDQFDERRMKLQMMQGSIDKTKAEIEKLNGNNDEGPIEIMISRKGGR